MIKEKIRQTTENGDLAVILYTIFGYPDRRTSQKALMMLQPGMRIGKHVEMAFGQKKS